MLKIGDSVISNFARPFIIAEIGSNHNGDMRIARKLIKMAVWAGCDAVKFQSWSKDSLFCKKFYETHRDYKDKDFGGRNLEQMVELFSINEREHAGLCSFAKKNKIEFISSAFSRKEVDMLNKLKVKVFKVASMDLNNYPFLEYIAKKDKPMILSTGLSSIKEIKEAVRTIFKAKNKKVILLHCVSNYPPEDKNINLKNIDMLRDLFNLPVGYSDHTVGISASLAAIARGACLIERHFTLDRKMPGWDHGISSTPEEMKTLVDEAKRISLALGSYRRVVTQDDQEKKKIFRRSIVAAVDIKKGQKISLRDLDCKRPGTGLQPRFISLIIGKTAKKDISRDSIITRGDF